MSNVVLRLRDAAHRPRGTVAIAENESWAVTGTSTPAGGVLWDDDFEANRLASYFDYGLAGGTFARTAGAGRTGGYAMVSNLAQGQTEGGYLHVAFGHAPSGFTPVDSGTANYREVYWRFYTRTSANWTPDPDASKLTRATIFAATNWAQAMIAHVWQADSPNGTKLQLDPARGTDAGGTLVTTGYNDFAHLTFLGAGVGTTAIYAGAARGVWHCIEAHVRLNTAGQSNGVFEFWIDGVLQYSETALNWVGTYSTYGINCVMLESYFNTGAPNAQTMAFDDFVISTDRIGSVVPTTIANLVATAGDGQAVLTWTAPTGAATQQPQYRATGSGTWLSFGNPLGPTAVTVTVTGLTNGTPYEFRVKEGDV